MKEQNKDWEKIVLKRVKENLKSVWKKGYQNEEGFDDEEGDILGMIEYAISEYRQELKKKVVEKIKKMRKPDIWKYTGWDTPEINISKDEFRQCH